MNSIADSLIPALEQLPLELILMNSDGKMKFHTGRKIWHQKDETNECFQCDPSQQVICGDCPIRKVMTILQSGISPVTIDGSLPKQGRSGQEWFDVRVHGVVLENDEMLLISIYDISDYVEREREFLLPGERFKQIGKKTSKVLHDLKNPLSILTGVTELFKMDIETLKAEGVNVVALEDNLEMLISSSDKTLKMIEELTDYAAGRSSITEVKPIILKSWLPSFLPNPPKNIILETSVSGNPVISGDEGKLGDVLWNLVKNSMEAIGRKEGKITVSAKESAAMITISIRDNGPGIPDVVKENLFTEGVTSGKANGHGFGLSSARESVESMGGRITLNNELTMGTEFILTIPVQPRGGK